MPARIRVSSRELRASRSAVAVVLLAGLAPAGAVQAATFIQSATCITYPVTAYDCDIQSSTVAGGVAASTNAFSDSEGQTSGYVNAGLGWIQGYAEAFADTTHTASFTEVTYQTWTEGSFSDVVTITPANSGLLGIAANMTFNVSIAVTSSVSGETYYPEVNVGLTSWQLLYGYITDQGSLDAIPTFTEALALANLDSNGVNNGPDGPGTYSGFIPFTLGEPFVFRVGINGGAIASGLSAAGLGPQGGSAILDYAHTIEWQGIVGLTDENGTPIEFTATSLSGMDWSQPVQAVPLPGAMWLFAGALAALGRRVRRR